MIVRPCRSCHFKKPCRPGRRVCLECEAERARTRKGAAPASTAGLLDEHRLRARLATLEAQNRSLLVDLDRADTLRDLQEGADAARRGVRPIRVRERGGKLAEACAVALASDWHIEEEVRPEQVAGRNTYNVEIARRRMERFFQAVRWGLGHSRGAFTIRDLVLWLGGDIITNYLHADNVESNLLSPVQAIALAQVSISAGIKFLLEDDQLERLVVPCNDGNHGRLTEKTRAATRTANSIEWLLYTMLAREWAHEKRVQFVIAEGEHLYHDIYGRTVRFVHGDSVRYQGGVGGVTIPIYKALARWDTVRRADLTVMGHFHQRTSLSDLVINGSLIGYSPYALTMGARFEPPAQEFFVLDPKRFKSLSLPLWVSES